MKKIVVPVDFSECSEYALKVAAKLAKKHQAEIIVLHMMGFTDTVLTQGETQQMLEGIYYLKLAQKRFKKFLDKDYLKGISITDSVYNYIDFNELSTFAVENKADLIVMGSHGSSGLSELFVGSNTEKVVRHSEIPVLVIKNGVENDSFERAVFACDFSLENITAFKKAMKLFTLLNTKVTLLYVNLPGPHFRNSIAMESHIKDFLIHADALNLMDRVKYYSDYSVEEGIFNYSNSHQINVISLPTHGRKGLAHFFSGSIGEDLVNHSKIPVLTFKI